MYKCHPEESVAQTDSASLTYTRGVTQTGVPHKGASHLLQSDTHMKQGVHSDNCCGDTCTRGCVIHTLHTCLSVSHNAFQAKWISHPWLCATNAHPVPQTHRDVSHSRRHVSPNAGTDVSRIQRVIHVGVRHTRCFTRHLTDTQVLLTHTSDKHSVSHTSGTLSVSPGAFHGHTRVSRCHKHGDSRIHGCLSPTYT